MWLVDLAIYQLNHRVNSDYEYYEKNRNYARDIYDVMYDALCEPDMAQRIGFKKLFIDTMLRGDGKRYAKVAEEFENELHELDRFALQRTGKHFSRRCRP